MEFFKAFEVVDNITFVREFEPNKALYKAQGRPFENNGIIYSPRYRDGKLLGYSGRIKNMHLYIRPGKIFLVNSLHKFWHGCNYNDFHFDELKMAIESLCEISGLNWKLAFIKKIEFGCNIHSNADATINSLLSYKGKDFQPMVRLGLKYGASCEFEQYRVKGYNKRFEVMKQEKINLEKPLFRWEIQVRNPRYFARYKHSIPINVNQLLTREFQMLMANDAVSIYQNSIKKRRLNLRQLSTHEKRILAEMFDPEIRDEIKIHHKETFKRDRRIYRRIMINEGINLRDETVDLLKQKFVQLIE